MFVWCSVHNVCTACRISHRHNRGLAPPARASTFSSTLFVPNLRRWADLPNHASTYLWTAPSSGLRHLMSAFLTITATVHCSVWRSTITVDILNNCSLGTRSGAPQQILFAVCRSVPLPGKRIAVLAPNHLGFDKHPNVGLDLDSTRTPPDGLLRLTLGGGRRLVFRRAGRGELRS